MLKFGSDGSDIVIACLRHCRATGVISRKVLTVALCNEESCPQRFSPQAQRAPGILVFHE